MFTVEAAARLTDYVWFKYTSARNTAYNDHNPEHVLVLTKGDIFGVRQTDSAVTYDLVDITASRVVFTFSKAEILQILKRATGHSFVHRGKPLLAGNPTTFATTAIEPSVTTTPHVSSTTRKPRAAGTQTRVHIHQNDVENGLYPHVNMPPTKAEISRLYTLFNKKYFNNECPDLSKVNVSLSTALRFLGQASLKYSISSQQFDYKLKIAKSGFTDGKRVCNIVLHEMIHLRHFKKGYEDNDDNFKNTGHGPLFLEDMHRLNALGFKIDVKDDGFPEKAELHETTYVLMFGYKPGANAVRLDGQDAVAGSTRWFFFYSNKDFKNTVPDIIRSVQGRFSFELVKAIYGKTKCSHVYLGRALTKQARVPENIRGVRIFDSSSPNNILKELFEELQVITEIPLEINTGTKEIREEIVRAANSCESVLYADWHTYLNQLLIRAGVLAIVRFYPMSTLLSSISEDEKNYIHSRWVDVKPYHFTKNKEVKQNTRELLKTGLDGMLAVNFLMQQYAPRFKDRIDADQAADLIIEMYGKILTDSNATIRSWVRQHYTAFQ